jgi:uncharacterized Zn-finger protein
MAEVAQFLARRPFGHLGIEVTRDQVISLDHPDALVASGVVLPVAADASIVTCPICGARFIADYALRAHARRHHRG